MVAQSITSCATRIENPLAEKRQRFSTGSQGVIPHYKMKNFALLIIIIFSLITPINLYAKRKFPEDVQSVTHAGIRYEAPHFDVKRKQNGGYIKAFDQNTNKHLWTVQIYKTTYQSSVEQDVQDIFITSIKIKERTLFIYDEKNRIFQLNLKDKTVKRVEQVGFVR